MTQARPSSTLGHLAMHYRDVDDAPRAARLLREMGFTECYSTPGCCELEPSCTVRSNSQVISRALRRTLEQIRLSDLIRPLRLQHAASNREGSVVSITLTSGRTQ